jgi:threonine-phosphate decarboxylase
MSNKSENVPLHGGQLRQISERFGIPVSRLIDFSANINPEGPPAAVIASLRASLEDVSVLTTYPDLDQIPLKQSIAEYCGTGLRNVVVANGFVPLLECALRTLQVKRCLVPVPSFVEYRRTLTRAGVKIDTCILNPQTKFSYQLDALVHGGHDAILLANPQNPSGILTARKYLRELVSECANRRTRVLLDEAFIDYAPLDSLTADVNEFGNLIVFRSVTKFYGIPGLRVAYAAASEDVAWALTEDLPPWPITTLASCAVVAALEDQPFAAGIRVHNDRRRERLKAGLATLGIESYPSAANYLLIRLPLNVSPQSFWSRMIVENQMVLRDCSNYEGLPPGYLRAAVRTDRENEQLLKAISLTLPSATRKGGRA